jgi:undecaprenyl pyrophosphate phosphatase UppP
LISGVFQHWQTNCTNRGEVQIMPLLYLVIALVLISAIATFVNANVRTPENMKRIVNLVLALIVVGMALWLVNTYIPMAESIKTILNIVVVAATCVFVLQAVGLWDGFVRFASNTWRKITTPKPPTEANQSAR